MTGQMLVYFQAIDKVFQSNELPNVMYENGQEIDEDELPERFSIL